MKKVSASLCMFLFVACFAISLTLRQNRCPNNLRLGPVGGRGGNYFDDWAYTNNTVVHPFTFNIYSDKYINSIQIIYKDSAGNTINGGTYGGDEGSLISWTVPDGEKIVKAIVYGGAWVDSIQFITDANTESPKWGGTGGRRRELRFNGDFTSIWGKSSSLLDQIGFNICNKDINVGYYA